MSIVPVALFAYSRPVHLTKVLEALKANDVPLIYAFVDGAKDDFSAEKVNAVKGILQKVNWTSIHMKVRENNLGLARSIRSGVSEVLEMHDRVIVIEDDIVMRKGAYNHTVSALSHFEDDERIMSVSMWTDPRITLNSTFNGFLSGRFICWGWATYKKYWDLYSGSPLEMYKKCLDADIDVSRWGNDIKLQADIAEEKNLWYVGYVLTHMLYGKLSYFPMETHTINIGRDGSGENTGGGKQDNLNLITRPVVSKQEWPEFYDDKIHQKFFNYFNPRQKKTLKEIFYNLIYKNGVFH